MRPLPFHEIAPGSYRIDEFGGANCYLLLGREKALLVDTGNGLGDLRGTVASLTDLPVEVVATHGHGDHTGGAGQFPRMWLHEADTAFIYKLAQARPVSRMLLKSPSYVQQGITKADFAPASYKTRVDTFVDGQVFSLGGRDVRALHTPGHTRGSVVLLDDKEGLMLTGDNVCPALWLWVPGATTLEAWLPGARKTLDLARRYTAYAGHGEGPQSPELIEQLIEIAERLLAERDKNAFFGRTLIYPSKENAVTIWCRTGHLHE